MMVDSIQEKIIKFVDILENDTDTKRAVDSVKSYPKDGNENLPYPLNEKIKTLENKIIKAFFKFNKMMLDEPVISPLSKQFLKKELFDGFEL